MSSPLDNFHNLSNHKSLWAMVKTLFLIALSVLPLNIRLMFLAWFEIISWIFWQAARNLIVFSGPCCLLSEFPLGSDAACKGLPCQTLKHPAVAVSSSKFSLLDTSSAKAIPWQTWSPCESELLASAKNDYLNRAARHLFWYCGLWQPCHQQWAFFCRSWSFRTVAVCLAFWSKASMEALCT